GDISLYTETDDVPLTDVLEAVKEKNGGQPVDIKAIGDDAAVREYFAEILPDFDRERVYTSDIKKLLTWYNLLLEGGITEFADKEASAPEVESAPESEEK
ncbi:hypothetical protein, partial [uncultured Duncaniella sp.]|uniref:DUF6852 domain-containing protein n=1 Tax=uncultured Duncaniella sp. TaxID=2768039 RepID=UPI0025B6C58C